MGQYTIAPQTLRALGARPTLPPEALAPFDEANPPQRSRGQEMAGAAFENAIDAFLGSLGMAPTGETKANLLGQLVMAAVPVVGGAKTLKELAKRIPNPIKAYHGSPYDFEAFDISKIGTGEGRQAYGHGLYFAESPEVAQSYKEVQGRASVDPAANVASKVMRAGNDPAHRLKTIFPEMTDGEIAAAIDRAKNAPPGRMYEVNIHADPEHMLDWDKPLSQQSEHVQNAVRSGIDNSVLKAWQENGAWQHATGKDLYDLIGGTRMGDMQSGRMAQGSNTLNQADIPGIKYLDAGSKRNNASLWHDAENNRWGVVHNDPSGTVKTEYFPNEAAATKFRESLPETRNYVVFDDKRIEIVKKYGIAVALAAGLINESQARQLRAQERQ